MMFAWSVKQKNSAFQQLGMGKHRPI